MAHPRRMGLQSAMEYLMTYGWAILIIAVVLGALFQLGVFNATNFAPRVPAGACQVERLSTQAALAGECQGGLPQYVAQFNGGQPAQTPTLSTSYANGLTYCLWFDTNTVAVQQGQAGNCQGGPQCIDFWMDTGSSTTYLRWEVILNGRGANFYNTNIAISPNKWYFACGEYNTSLQEGSLYVDGNVATDSFSVNGVSYPYPIAIGAYSPSGYYFNGYIANFQIYNASLSANEVQALYLEGIGGAPIQVQNIVGWWPLNGNLNDYSGNGNGGQTAGSVTYTGAYLNGYAAP